MMVDHRWASDLDLEDTMSTFPHTGVEKRIRNKSRLEDSQLEFLLMK